MRDAPNFTRKKRHFNKHKRAVSVRALCLGKFHLLAAFFFNVKLFCARK